MSVSELLEATEFMDEIRAISRGARERGHDFDAEINRLCGRKVDPHESAWEILYEIDRKRPGKTEPADILKEHGADAYGKITRAWDGLWQAAFVVRNRQTGETQYRGPEFFEAEELARSWVVQQTKRHGFSRRDRRKIIHYGNTADIKSNYPT